MPLDDGNKRDHPSKTSGVIAEIRFSDDDPDDPFNTKTFHELSKKYDVSRHVDLQCGQDLEIQLSRTWDHVKVLVENTGTCEVTVLLVEQKTQNYPTYPSVPIEKAKATAAKKENGKEPHNGSAQAHDVNTIQFTCSADDWGGQCKFDYKIRAF